MEAVEESVESVLSIMKPHGDEHAGDMDLKWNKNSPAEVARCRAAFDDARAKDKYMAYRVNRDGTRGEVIREFDPNAERIIMTPPMVGG